MTRVLHLVGREPDHQTEHSRAMLLRDAAALGTDVQTRAIGPGGAYPNLFRAVIGLRRDVGAFDVTHAWDTRALTAAALAGARRIVVDAPTDLRRHDVGRLALVARHRDVAVVCGSAVQRDRLAAAGIPAERLHLVRPAVEVPAAPAGRDADLRRRLRIGADDFVLLAAGESTRPAAHERAVWTGSILHVTDERYRVLLWGRGPRAGAAADLGRKLRQPGLVVVAHRALGPRISFEELLPAADAMLVTARKSVSDLPVALAMAAGVPVISVETPLLRELRSRGPLPLIPSADAPRLLAGCVLDLRGDGARLRERLAHDGRAAAPELFAPAPLVAAYRALYASAGAGARAIRPAHATGEAVFPNAGASNLVETQT
jgi:glycosyltransferase involved in cell wall biosynthesis